MNLLAQGNAAEDLFAFYNRVKPVLYPWLDKPVWSATETAMLCAGYLPGDVVENEPLAFSTPESNEELTPIDFQGNLPPDRSLYLTYLNRLDGKASDSPCRMVLLLTPKTTKEVLAKGENGQSIQLEIRRPFTLKQLRELQWFFIIASAVGLQVPALVHFRQLDQLSRHLTSSRADYPSSKSGDIFAAESPARVEKEPSERPDSRGSSAELKSDPASRKPRETRVPEKTPSERGYYTTEEVAGLTNLLPATLNKYARENKPVEGYIPFKRLHGRRWQWRDEQQQKKHEVNRGVGKL